MDTTNKLLPYGLTETFVQYAEGFPDLVMARVISQYRDLYRVVTASSEGLAEVSGKFRYESSRLSDYPAVGDFVMLDRADLSSGNAIIHQVLPRKSFFERSAIATPGETQVVAANIDYLFICMALNNDYNLNRLERYLSLGWSSGAQPVVILTKADLCENLDATLTEVSAVSFGAEVIATSNKDDSAEQLRRFLRPGTTASFIGSSGVGKTTLINSLIGEDVLETSETRKDDKGRHTTTRRDMIALPGGSAVIDTPGMREMGVESADLTRSFSDIDELSARCRFSDCSHGSEPGCAVQEALAQGELDERHYANYLKLKKESRYEGMNSRQIEAEKINNMVGGFAEMKHLRKHFKEKNDRREM